MYTRAVTIPSLIMSKENVLRLGAKTQLSCDSCVRTIKHRLCAQHVNELETEFFNRGVEFERKRLTEGLTEEVLC